MKCPECRGLNGHHERECVNGIEIQERYSRVLNKMMAWKEAGDVRRLREAHDALSELIAWAASVEEPVGVFPPP